MPWMGDDPVFRDLRNGVPVSGAAGRLAPLAGAWSDPDGFVRSWCNEWQRRVPPEARADGALLGEFARVLDQHRTALAEPAARDGVLPRRPCVRGLRSSTGARRSNPAAAFIFLALCALDMERLRGELLRRAIFPRFGVAA